MTISKLSVLLLNSYITKFIMTSETLYMNTTTLMTNSVSNLLAVAAYYYDV
jgi:hypothetical protein